MSQDNRKIERSVKNLQILAQCSICLSSYKDPIMCKRCKYIFCKKCVLESYKKGKNECPLCRQEQSIDDWIKLKDSNEETARCLTDVVNEYNLNKELISKKEKEIQELKHELELMESSRDRSDYCPNHRLQEMNLYCYNCKKRVCSTCLCLNYSNHEHHKIIEFKKLEDIKWRINSFKLNIEEHQFVENYNSYIEKIEKTEAKLLDYLDNLKNAVINKKKETIQKMKETYDKLKLKIETYEELSKNVNDYKPRDFNEFIQHKEVSKLMRQTIEVNDSYVNNFNISNFKLMFYDERDFSSELLKDLLQMDKLKLILDLYDDKNKIKLLTFGKNSCEKDGKGWGNYEGYVNFKGEPDVYGHYTCYNGYQFKGAIKNNKENGFGKVILEDGDEVIGEFIDGKKEGQFSHKTFWDRKFCETYKKDVKILSESEDPPENEEPSEEY